MKKSAGGVPEGDPKAATFRSSLSQDVRAMLSEYARARQEKADRSRYERHAFLQEVRNRVAVLKGDVPVPDTAPLSEPSATLISVVAMPSMEEEAGFIVSALDGVPETAEAVLDVLSSPASDVVSSPEDVPSEESRSEPSVESSALVPESPLDVPLAVPETEVSVPSEPESGAEMPCVQTEEPAQAHDGPSTEDLPVEAQDAIHADSEASTPPTEARSRSKPRKSTKSSKPRKQKGDPT